MTWYEARDLLERLGVKVNWNCLIETLTGFQYSDWKNCVRYRIAGSADTVIVMTIATMEARELPDLLDLEEETRPESVYSLLLQELLAGRNEKRVAV